MISIMIKPNFEVYVHLVIGHQQAKGFHSNRPKYLSSFVWRTIDNLACRQTLASMDSPQPRHLQRP